MVKFKKHKCGEKDKIPTNILCFAANSDNLSTLRKEKR